jgi:hypothetical protein
LSEGLNGDAEDISPNLFDKKYINTINKGMNKNASMVCVNRTKSNNPCESAAIARPL